MTWQEKCLASDTGYPVGQCFLKCLLEILGAMFEVPKT